MAENYSSAMKELLAFYENGREEGRAKQSRSNSMEFRYTQKILQEYLKPNSKVIELGCATGYYAMCFADLCAEYVGVDVVPEHIASFQQKIAQYQKHNIRAMVGDATDLSEIPDDSFDLVLCLGPMYHLPPQKRNIVLKECYRIGREQAVFAFAYINRLLSYMGSFFS